MLGRRNHTLGRSDRMSRRSAPPAASLAGLSARELYAVERLDRSRILERAHWYMGAGLWCKFDRFRPLSAKQRELVRLALNRAAMELCPDYPRRYPVIALTTDGGGPKQVISLVKIKVAKLPTRTSDDGTIYLAGGEPLEIEGVEAEVGFSSHAIDRLLERRPELIESAHLVDSRIVPAVLAYVASADRVDLKGNVPMLSVAMPGDGVLGYFPLRHADGMWIATTFLLPGMDGTPETLTGAIRRLVERFA